VEKAGHQRDEPVGEARALERHQDEVVVHGVEGLGRVHEEDEEVAFALAFHRLVVGLVELTDVILEDAPGDEALLRPVQRVVEAGGDGEDDGLGHDAVVGVGDRDWTSIARGEGTLFRDEEEEAVVVAGGG
jgi:hypothetical protein